MRIFLATWLLLPLVPPAAVLAKTGKGQETVIRACTRSVDRESANQALAAFGKRMEVADVASRAEDQQAWETLLAQPCFQLPGRILRMLFWDLDLRKFLVAWWRDGGEEFLRGYIDIAGRWKVGNDGKYFVLPAEPRKRLSEIAEDNPLNEWLSPALLCPDVDRPCDPEAQEAMNAFEQDAEEDEAKTKKELAECRVRAKRLPRTKRFEAFVACTGGLFKQWRVPLAGLRVPDRGWLVLLGWRGYHGACEGIRAYDLKTGTAFIVRSCDRRTLGKVGGVEVGAIRDGYQTMIEVGRLPVPSLRVAALLLMAGMQSWKRDENTWVELPNKIEPVLVGESYAPLFPLLGSSWFSTNQTWMHWSWQVEGKIEVAGEATWPDSDNAMESYALERLRLAESAFVPGCPRVPLPRTMVPGASEGTIKRFISNRKVEEHREQREKMVKRLSEALAQAFAIPACPAVP